uniref:BY PROTMAP: gi/342318868/gb/EGU10825.1/ putative Chloride channel protein k [Rhodotorula glutinis ATCC 204091] n=1 Tax=Rhodotorula toruloides TaxID=5286 RepID=A0A0K3CCE9_RHOTO
MALEPTRGYTPSLSFEAPFGSRGGGGTKYQQLLQTLQVSPLTASLPTSTHPTHTLPHPAPSHPNGQSNNEQTHQSLLNLFFPPTALEHGVEDAWSDFQHVVWPFLRSWIQAMPNQVQGHATCNIKTRRAAAKEAARTKLTEPSDLKGGVAARTQWADLRWCWKVAAAAVEEGEAAAGDLGAAVVEALEGYEEARAYEEACFEDWQLANSRTSVRQYKLLELSKVMAERLLAQQGRRGEMSEVREDIVVSHGYDLLAGHLTKKRK